MPLSTRREMSSIKRNTAEGPVHQPEGHSRWMYPSQQMFFNAMKRKGWDPQEQDMPSVVAIHNAVNERAWGQVLEWEALHEGDCGSRRVRLKSFSGDAKKLSPRARFLMAMGYSAPFDRHDWVSAARPCHPPALAPHARRARASDTHRGCAHAPRCDMKNRRWSTAVARTCATWWTSTTRRRCLARPRPSTSTSVPPSTARRLLWTARRCGHTKQGSWRCQTPSSARATF